MACGDDEKNLKKTLLLNFSERVSVVCNDVEDKYTISLKIENRMFRKTEDAKRFYWITIIIFIRI